MNSLNHRGVLEEALASVLLLFLGVVGLSPPPPWLSRVSESGSGSRRAKMTHKSRKKFVKVCGGRECTSISGEIRESTPGKSANLLL
jgi:hypothetical protein